MKRSLITTLIIGAVVALVVGALHATKVIAGFEAVVAQLVTDYTGATRVVGEKWQYVLVFLIASGVAWLGLSNVPRWRTSILIGLLLVELFVLAWVCSLYRVFFQPTPSILALLFAFAAAEGWSAFLRRNCSHLLRALFADRVSTEQFRRLGDGRISFETDPRTYEVSVVVCDIGNKLTFAEGGEPAAFTEATAKFIRETAASLVEARRLLASRGRRRRRWDFWISCARSGACAKSHARRSRHDQEFSRAD